MLRDSLHYQGQIRGRPERLADFVFLVNIFVGIVYIHTREFVFNMSILLDFDGYIENFVEVKCKYIKFCFTNKDIFTSSMNILIFR